MGFHFSGRGVELPGWVLVSTHDEDAQSHTWMDDELFAMELKPNGRVVRLAHTHSIVNQGGGQDYFAEPQATVNRDFTKALFTTNWGRTGTQQVETTSWNWNPAGTVRAGWSARPRFPPRASGHRDAV